MVLVKSAPAQAWEAPIEHWAVWELTQGEAMNVPFPWGDLQPPCYPAQATTAGALVSAAPGQMGLVKTHQVFTSITSVQFQDAALEAWGHHKRREQGGGGLFRTSGRPFGWGRRVCPEAGMKRASSVRNELVWDDPCSKPGLWYNALLSRIQFIFVPLGC